MGLFKSIGRALKKVTRPVGKVLKTVAPIAAAGGLAVTGVGGAAIPLIGGVAGLINDRSNGNPGPVYQPGASVPQPLAVGGALGDIVKGVRKVGTDALGGLKEVAADALEDGGSALRRGTPSDTTGTAVKLGLLGLGAYFLLNSSK